MRLLLASLVGFLLLASPANAATKYVKCDEGDSIGKAIESAKGSADRLEITVSGECHESITIRRDHVWITGESSPQINGTVRVFSSVDVRFNFLTISGPGAGLVVSDSGVMTNGVNLAYNQFDGLNIRRRGHVWFRNGVIIGNCENFEDEDCSDGATVENGSLELVNASVYDSRYGISADVGSRVILNTTGMGITEIVNNSVVGVQVALHSVVDLRGNSMVFGNKYHGLFATQDSAIRISNDGVAVFDNIGCSDEESSFDNWGGGTYVGTDCTGF